jgi:predicted metal-dependent phosphoesterase TrpH
MNATSLLLKAYYEALYELLEAHKDTMTGRINAVLADEIQTRGYEDFDGEKFTAYSEACQAFIDERIEMYNPFGIQYLYDRSRTKEAFELELQLNWYDSRAEFKALVEAARRKVDFHAGREDFGPLAKELMKEVGAFPDKSIISAYRAKPALNKLPDYIVARIIEEIIS